MRKNRVLFAGGLLSVAASLLHLFVIVGGPAWYRFFGAGEGMAQMAERGEITPTLTTIAIASILAIWAAYAFAGAGAIRRLPLMRTALVLISAVYLLRGLVLIPALIINKGSPEPFVLWSSLIVLVYGLCYVVGTWVAWPQLSQR